MIARYLRICQWESTVRNAVAASFDHCCLKDNKVLYWATATGLLLVYVTPSQGGCLVALTFLTTVFQSLNIPTTRGLSQWLITAASSSFKVTNASYDSLNP